MVSALVTGANRGVGLGLVKELLKRKDVTVVFATKRSGSKCEELESIKDERLHILCMDVCRNEEIHKAVEEVSAIVGESGLDVLINNAGVMCSYPLEGAVNRNLLREHFDINTISPLVIAQIFFPLLKTAAAKRGFSKLINMSSRIGSLHDCTGGSVQGYHPYAMGKAALNMMTRSLSVDYKKEGIICMAISPGWVRTEMGGQEAALSVEESTCDVIVSILDKLNLETEEVFFDRLFNPLQY